MKSSKLLAITASSVLVTALAGCASNQESESDIINMKTGSDTENISGDKSARFNVQSSSSSSSSAMSSSSSSSAYSLSSAEMLSNKRSTVYFDFDSARLDSEAENTLMQLPKLDQYDVNDVTITLTGHTDATGPEAYNMTLSRERAEAVKQAIMDNFPASTTFEIVAEGESEPKTSNESEYGRSKNRRVEITYSAE